MSLLTIDINTDQFNDFLFIYLFTYYLTFEL